MIVFFHSDERQMQSIIFGGPGIKEKSVKINKQDNIDTDKKDSKDVNINQNDNQNDDININIDNTNNTDKEMDTKENIP